MRPALQPSRAPGERTCEQVPNAARRPGREPDHAGRRASPRPLLSSCEPDRGRHRGARRRPGHRRAAHRGLGCRARRAEPTSDLRVRRARGPGRGRGGARGAAAPPASSSVRTTRCWRRRRTARTLGLVRGSRIARARAAAAGPDGTPGQRRRAPSTCRSPRGCACLAATSPFGSRRWTRPDPRPGRRPDRRSPDRGDPAGLRGQHQSRAQDPDRRDLAAGRGGRGCGRRPRRRCASSPAGWVSSRPG